MNMKVCILLLAIGLLTASGLAAQRSEGDFDPPAESGFAAGAAEMPPQAEDRQAVSRTTIVPWSVAVLGKNFDSFPNDEASQVLIDWLVNSLIRLNVFNVVNRDKMQAVLSEQNLTAGGYAEDISPTALAGAGRLLKVNYILSGNFKNLGKTIEVDFKLLDVNTTTYSHRFSKRFPFNPEIEAMRPEIDRIVADLAARFPVLARLQEILDDRHLVLAAGAESGICDAMEVEIWPNGGKEAVARGFVTRAADGVAEVELDRAMARINLFDYKARITIVPPAQAAFARGLRDFEEGRFQEAAEVFRKGLESDPDDGLLHAYYARSCWHGGDRKVAVDAFREAIDRRPDDVELLEDAAAAMLESGQIEELIEVLGDETRRSSPRLVLQFGQAHEILGDLEQAREAFQSVLSRDPRHAKAHLRMAVLATKRRQIEEAGRELRLAQQGGGSLELELAAASFEVARASPGDARTRLDSLLERARQEKDFTALTTAAEMLLSQPSLWALSLELARHSLSLNTDDLRATIAAARAFAAGGEASEALALLDDVLTAYPNSVAVLLLSGELLTAEQNYVEAESRFRRAADLARGDPRPRIALGDIYSRQQDHLKAVSAYLDALERAEAGSNGSFSPLLHQLGKAAVAANQHDTARPYLERCVAASPDNQECQFLLGRCYFEDGSPQTLDRALASFRAAAGVPESSYYLGALYDRREEFDAALVHYRKCLADNCSVAEQSRRRVSFLESITGTITEVTHRWNNKKPKSIAIDVGRIHDVTLGKEGFIVQGPQVAGRVKVTEVYDKTSVAEILQGKPMVGQTVRFRPASPKAARAQWSQKRVVLRWQASAEPEVAYYEVFKSSRSRGGWRMVKKLKHPGREFVDKSVKPGNTVYYRVVAISEAKTRSLNSIVVAVKAENAR